MNPVTALDGIPMLWFVIATLWSLPWKGVALWKAAQLAHKKWFITILVLNTFGVLDIIYIYFIATKYKVEVVEEK